jgi:hypothetical protein
MNVYVIYKFKHKDLVFSKLKDAHAKAKKVYFFAFDPDKKNVFWRWKARKKIKKSNIVVFFDIEDEKNIESDSKKEKRESIRNLLWELRYAEKKNKRIVFFRKNDKAYSDQIFKLDYSEKEVDFFRYSIEQLDDFTKFFVEESSWSIKNKLMNHITDFDSTKDDNQNAPENLNQNAQNANEPVDQDLLIDQYRIMIETSETMMERRQQLGTMYTTICTAVLAFLGAACTFDEKILSVFCAFVSGLIIIFFCHNWKKSMDSYDLNNRGKFAVIEEIEKYLPANMFECEYRYKTMNGIKSYSNREKILPTIFQAFGIIIMAVSIIFLIPKIPEILSIAKNVFFNK